MSRAQFPVVVHILLRRRGSTGEQIYLQRRQNTGFLDGFFVLPGGHAEQDELPLAAAARELMEETGLRDLPLRPCALLPYATRRGSGINLVFETVLEGSACTELPTLAEPAVADLALWADVAALPEPLPGWIRTLLQLHSRGDWYAEVRSGKRVTYNARP
ncbi:MAG: NUDIX domain-containing protein [Pseudomonadota bacterium]